MSEFYSHLVYIILKSIRNASKWILFMRSREYVAAHSINEARHVMHDISVVLVG